MPRIGRGIRANVRKLFRLALPRRDLAQVDVDDEIRFHIDARTQQLVADGMTPDAARREAERRFGSIDVARAQLGASAARQAAQQTLRDRIDAVATDFRYVLRGLSRNRGFTFAVVTTLGLGIGATAAMFGVIDRLILRGPEHIQARNDIRRLYITTSDSVKGQETYPAFGYVMYSLLRATERSFAGVAAYSGAREVTFGAGAAAERIRLANATWDFFQVLGVQPALGRLFTPDEA